MGKRLVRVADLLQLPLRKNGNLCEELVKNLYNFVRKYNNSFLTYQALGATHFLLPDCSLSLFYLINNKFILSMKKVKELQPRCCLRPEF